MMKWLFLLLLPTQAVASTGADFGCIPGAIRSPYAQKPDFASLEAGGTTRIPERALRAVTPQDFSTASRGFDQECIDRIYAGLPSGPIPELGVEFTAHGFLPDGGGFKAVLGELLPRTGLKGWIARGIELTLSPLPGLLVQNKTFARARGGDHPVYTARSRLLAPMKVYCGQSLIDSRRESIIIDPSYPEDFPEFKPGLHEFPGHAGMNLREEIRMIRPGFYLGRIYGAQVYLMSFTLYNAKVDQGSSSAALAVPERNACWLGTQAR